MNEKQRQEQQRASGRTQFDEDIEKAVGVFLEEVVWFGQELALVLAPALLALYLHLRQGWSWVLAGVLFAVLLAALLSLPVTRRQLRTSHVRRDVRRACQECDIARVRVRRTERVGVGLKVYVQWAPGSSFVQVDGKREELASSLRVRELRVERDPANASRGILILAKRDAFSAMGGHQWPLA